MINLAVLQSYIDHCSNVPQGTQLSTFIKACFFIYEQDGDNGVFKIVDKSTQVAFYDVLTDQHEVFVTIYNESGTVCYTETMEPFGNLSFTLPELGCYIVEIDVRYSVEFIQDSETIPYTFQNVYMYPVNWEICGDYHNQLINDIKCRISKLQCEINKRRCVGRSWCELQERVYALINYHYALCNYSFNSEEFDMIKCKVNTIKKAC